MHKGEQNKTKFYYIIDLNDIKTVVIKYIHFIKISLYKLSICIRITPYMLQYVKAFSSALNHIVFPILHDIRHNGITSVYICVIR